MKIYTRRGDGGETGLLGGERVAKTDARVRAYGEIDELSAHLGVALAVDDGEIPAVERLKAIQDDLLTIGARLAAAEPEKARKRGIIPELDAGRIGEFERWIDELESDLPPLEAFVLPGGCPAGAQLHVCRTVCRRAERSIVALQPEQPELGELVLPYMNRLSDLLFVLARATNQAAGRPEPSWTPQRER